MLQFKDLKPNYPVFILNKNGEKKIHQGKVINVSPSATQNNMMQMQMISDVTIECNGVTRTYSIPDSLTVTYSSDLVIATEIAGILQEVQVLKRQCEEELSKSDERKKDLKEYEKILSDWDPSLREKMETNERFEKIDERFNKMETSITDLKTTILDMVKGIKS